MATWDAVASPEKKKTHDTQFTFEWEIKDFSMCARPTDGFLESPVFRANLRKESTLYLKLFPKTFPHETKCTLGLFVDETYCGQYEFRASIEIRIPRMDFRIYDSHDHVILDSQSTEVLFNSFSRSDLTYTPETLIVQCILMDLPILDIPNPLNKYICPMSIPSSDFEDVSFIRSSMESRITRTFKPFYSTAHTRVDVFEKMVTWKIRGYKEWDKGLKKSVYLESDVEDALPLILTLHKSEEPESGDLILEICKDDLYVCNNSLIVKCRIGVEEQPKDVILVDCETRCFDKECNDPLIINIRSTVIIDGCNIDLQTFLSPEGDITFKFQIGISVENFEYLTKNTTFLWRRRSSENHVKVLKKGMTRLFKNKNLNEFKLVIPRVCEFNCDKTIISARSDFLAERISNDDAESLDIDDVDKETLDRFLAFMYSAVLEKLDVFDLLNLYWAAKRYQFSSLSLSCKHQMRWKINKNNIVMVSSMVHQSDDRSLDKWIDEEHETLQRLYV